jgi:hypothetical protein
MSDASVGFREGHDLKLCERNQVETIAEKRAFGITIFFYRRIEARR